MHIAIVGSRGYMRLDVVRDYISKLPEDTVIVSGGARGVDTAAEDAARARGLQTLIFPAEWSKYGKSAGFKRNQLIVDASQKLVAFWDGSSRGTKSSIDLAYKKGIEVEVIYA